jgi:glucokinase
MRDWVIGVDLGGTKIEVGLVSPENHIVGRRKIPTRSIEGPRAVVERIAQQVEQLAELLPAGGKNPRLGVCSPGAGDHETGTLVDPPNLPGLHNAPLRQLLAERLSIPVHLEHDAKATALGEFHFGAGQGEQSMVFVIVGTGVGAAIIDNGQMVRGKFNSAGEIGHVTLDPKGDPCSCGSRGCVETYVAGPGLVRHYKRALEQQLGQAVDDPISGETVATLAGNGDPIALRIMTEAGEALGLAVANMAMLLNIDLFVVGGSVAKAGDLLLEPARRIIPKYTYRSVGCGVHLLATEMGDDGPILGCAWLAREAARRDTETRGRGDREKMRRREMRRREETRRGTRLRRLPQRHQQSRHRRMHLLAQPIL